MKNKKVIIFMLLFSAIILTVTILTVLRQDNEKIEIQAREINEYNMTYVNSSDGKSVPIPTGYVASSVDSERNVSKGFVIYQGTDPVNSSNVKTARTTRNQWVWVPVSNVNNLYHSSGKYIYGNRYIFTTTGYSINKSYSAEPATFDTESQYLTTYLDGITTDEFISQLREEFVDMLESIKTYGGFYIGRYETGNLSQDIPKITKFNEDINLKNGQNWYRAYEKCKRIDSTNTSVRTGMIWGCQWDETIAWLVSSKAITYAQVQNSTSFGNYKNAQFDYYSSANATTTTRKGTGDANFHQIPTGSADYTMKNNIYDMAGNMLDFTIDGPDASLNRLERGGYHYDNGNESPLSGRGGAPTYMSFDNVGCRAMMYIL